MLLASSAISSTHKPIKIQRHQMLTCICWFRGASCKLITVWTGGSLRLRRRRFSPGSHCTLWLMYSHTCAGGVTPPAIAACCSLNATTEISDSSSGYRRRIWSSCPSSSGVANPKRQHSIAPLSIYVLRSNDKLLMTDTFPTHSNYQYQVWNNIYVVPITFVFIR